MDALLVIWFILWTAAWVLTGALCTPLIYNNKRHTTNTALLEGAAVAIAGQVILLLLALLIGQLEYIAAVLGGLMALVLWWFAVPHPAQPAYQPLSELKAHQLGRWALTAFSLSIAVIVVYMFSFKTFSLKTDMSLDAIWDAVQATPNYASVLFVNVLIAVSVLLLLIELKWDALRVMMTVIIALIFGYIVTFAFSLDAANRFQQGEFTVTLDSESEPLVNLVYGGEAEAEFDDTTMQGTYSFAGRAGDTITLLAYPSDEESALDLQLTLQDSAGQTLVERRSASPEQLETYSKALVSEADAVIENFVLPADGFYTVIGQPQGTEKIGEYTLELLSDAPSAVELNYGDDKGNVFNQRNAKDPVKEVSYSFAGRAGDVINIFAAVVRDNVEANLEVSLKDSTGKTLAENKDATAAQLAEYDRDLLRSSDAMIEGFVLPADGLYTIHTQPEPIARRLKFEEAFKKTSTAYEAFLMGPLSRLNRWITWIKDAITLIILGLSIALVFRAEQFSLGAEGQLYMGALVSGALALALDHDLPQNILVPMALLSAATAGFLWGLLPGALKAYLGANELVATLMLNTIAARFYEMVLTFQYQPPDAGFTASRWFEDAGILAPIIDDKGDQVTIAVYILIGLVILTWLLIQRTPLGYEIRMLGSNLKFASYGGVNTKRTIMLVMALSGAIAGLAGAHLAMGIHRRLILNISIGLAFEGVVVALLARNNPLVAPFTGLLYAYLRTGAQIMERDADISAEVVRIIQAAIILLITAEALVTFVRRRRQIRRRGSVELDDGPVHLVENPAQGA